MKIEEITSEEQLKVLTNDTSKLIVIDCTATWCGPCKVFGKFYEKFVSEFPEEFAKRVTFTKLDVEKMQAFCNINEIRNIPMILFVKNNNIVDRVKGNNPKLFKQFLETHLPKNQEVTV
jgi:thioredoxin 1